MRVGLAETEYRAALERAPDLLTARLRLGRALFVLGRPGPARNELETVRAAAAGDREVSYLAHLFLGALSVYEDDLQTARREYAAALALGPTYQTPYIALSFVEAMLGETAAARETAARGVRAGQRADDPATMYQYITGALRGGALGWLRAEARR